MVQKFHVSNCKVHDALRLLQQKRKKDVNIARVELRIKLTMRLLCVFIEENLWESHASTVEPLPFMHRRSIKRQLMLQNLFGF